MIQGNDGGVYVMRDSGRSWTFLNNLPIEQTYMVGWGALVRRSPASPQF